NSLFWEQALHLPQPYVDELQKLWNEWLLEQYGTRQGLSEAWTNHQGRGALMADEDPAAGSVRLPNVVEAFRLDWAHRSYGDPLQGTARCNDGARFYYELMRRYYRQMRDHLRSIGVKVPITSCVTPHIAPDLKAVADELDFISNGTYYDHPNLSVRKIQGSNPYGLAFNTVELHNVRGAAANVALGKVAGKPVIAREWNMPFPSEYRSEAMLQMAAYACLQDWDGLLFYGIGGGVLSFRNELQSFTCYTDPEHWCQFAVAALLFHRRDVQVAQSVLDVGYSHTDTFYAWRSHERVPTRYAAYVTRTQKAFFNRTYAGDADLVVSSGASAQGGYAQARRAFLWAENPAADLHDHVTGRAHVADDLEPAVRSELALVPELHLTHGFGTRLFTVENLGFDSLAMYATRDPAFRVDSLPQGAREIGSDGVHCLGYLHDGKLVLPHLTALDERMRDPQQHTLGRFLLDALNVLGITDKVSRRDLDKGVLRSVTGELARDLCRGVFTVDTPRTQAVVGLIGGSLFKLTDLTIELADQHGVVAATSLDDEPIATAKELLLTVLGRAMNTDQHREGSFVHLGRAPVLYRPAQGTLWLSGDWANAEAKITVCDPNGQPLGQIRATRDERGLKVPLGYAGPAVYYHIVRR
ncbi:MAG: beta-galactosidase, partial [Chloroflexi bacterium]|nr:beta-galactosidase [Chloroflexota bacterium]